MNLKNQFEQYPNVSIRKLAMATGINYGTLLKASRAPIPGEAYDPEAINWSALEAKLVNNYIDLVDLDWDSLNQGPNRHGVAIKKDINQYHVGDKVYFWRNNEVPFEILYITDSHIVVMLEGTTKPQAWSHNTFILNGPSLIKREEVK